VERIQAYSNCAITSRGEYVQPGRSVNAGQRKLHLLIEGESEFDVRKCANEINRVLEEATREVVSDKGRPQGKYKVL
jgi:ATP-dependent RNA helicase DDX46/PRP5